MSQPLSRRHFLLRGGLAAATAFVTRRTLAAGAGDRRLKGAGRLWVGAPSFMRDDDPEAWALAHVKAGYSCAYCPNVSLKDADRIRGIAQACERHHLVLAEVGRWVNMMDADSGKRSQNLATVTDGLALADAIGARCCVDIAGSFNREVWYGPHRDNNSKLFFEAAVENARKIIDAVKPRRAKFCYEMMGWALPDSPASCLKMLKAVDRPAFGVHLDPCNLVNSPERFYRNTELIHECFDKLGRWIVSCHAKDLTWDVEMNVHFREVRPGQGAIDYRTYLCRVAAMPNPTPLMIEHLPTEQEYRLAFAHIKETGVQCGLSLAGEG